MSLISLVLFIIACAETFGCIAWWRDIKTERNQLRKVNKKNIHYIIPFVINALVGFYIFYWVLLAIAFLWHGFKPNFLIYNTLIPVVVQTTFNVLSYIWFYSKKTDLTKKDFFKTCLLGANIVWVYIAYLQLF